MPRYVAGLLGFFRNHAGTPDVHADIKPKVRNGLEPMPREDFALGRPEEIVGASEFGAIL